MSHDYDLTDLLNEDFAFDGLEVGVCPPDTAVAGAPPPGPQLGSAELVTRESMQLSDVEASCKVAQPPSTVAAQASTVSLSFFMASIQQVIQ